MLRCLSCDSPVDPEVQDSLGLMPCTSCPETFFLSEQGEFAHVDNEIPLDEYLGG